MSDDPYAEILKGYSPSSQPSTDPYSEILSGYGQPKSTRGVADYKPRTLSTGNPQYDSWYDTYGKKHNVDPDLLIAQGKQESGFRKGAKSSAGAQGIAQFMPDTAKEFGVDVNSPESSIGGQALLMGKLLDRTKDTGLALAGYNSGHNASIQRLQRNLKRIPETRGYANNILGMYNKTTKPSQDKGNSSDPYADILSGYKPDIPPSVPPPTNPANVMPQPQTLPPPTPMGVNDQLMPQGLATQPVPETTATIQAQMKAALNPKVKDRAAVLTTDQSQNAIFGNNSGFIAVPVQQGTLWVNPAKARKLKLRTPQDIQMFVEKNPDGMTRLIGKVENVGDNTGGNQPVVQTVAPDGTELSSSVVTNPETAAKQVDVDKQSFPDSRTQVTTTDKVAQERQNAAVASPNAQKQVFATSEPTISDVPEPDPTEVIDAKNKQQVNQATANKIVFPKQMKSVGEANAYIRSQLQALYPQGDFSKVKLLTPETFGDGKNIGGTQVTYGLLGDAGVDVDSLIAQKVAENRVENPTPNLGVNLERSVPNPKELAEKVKQATRIPLFGYSDDLSGLFGGLAQNVGDLAGVMAGAMKSSPVYGAVNEIVSNGGTRPVRAADTTADALMDFYDSANAFNEATGAKDANGKDTIPTMLLKGAGQTPEYAIMSALPGGLVTGMALKNSLLARAKDKPWNEVVKELGWGAGEGALYSFLPKGVQKAFGADTSALKTIGRVGTEVAGISGGTYGMETLRDPNATPEDKLKGAISIGLFHLYGATKGALKGDVAHIVDAENNLDAYVKIEGPNKFTFVEKQKPNIDLVLPKQRAKVTETTLKPIDTKGENPETNTAIPKPSTSLGTEPLVQDTQVDRRAEDRRQQEIKDYADNERRSAERRVKEETLSTISPEQVLNLAGDKKINDATLDATIEKVTGKKSLTELSPQELLDVSDAIRAGVEPVKEAPAPEKGFEMKPAEEPTKSEPENITTNASGESATSQEAINRFASEKKQGLTRVVVDTRKPNAEPRVLTDAQAVDYQPSPYESVEYRGGERNGEVIAQGNDVRPNYSPPSRIEGETVAPKKIEEVTPDTHEIKDEGSSLDDWMKQYGDEPLSQRLDKGESPITLAREAIANEPRTESVNANERTPEARPNSESGTSDTAIKKPETPIAKSKSDAIPKPSRVVSEGKSEPASSEKPREKGNAETPVQAVEESAPKLTEGDKAKIINRFTKQGDLSKYRRKFQALTVDGKQRAIELVHDGMDANKAIKEAKKSPYPTDLKGAVEDFKATVENSSKDFKGDELATPEDTLPRDRSGERGAALVPSANQLRELGRAILDVPSRDWYQRIKDPIEKMMAQHREVRDVEFAAERLKKQTERAMEGMSPEERTAIIDAMEHDYKGKYMDALDARQKALAMELKPVHDMIQEYNQKNDVFTEREQAPGTRHLFHWWIDPKTDRPYSTNFGEFSKTGPSSKMRTIETYAEGRERSENPLKMASMNPGEILGKSYEQMVRVKEARDLVSHLKEWELTDPDGTQLKGIVAEPPKGMEDRYKELDVPSLNRSKFIPQGDALLMVKEPAYILKEIAPKIEAYFNHPDWGKADEVFSMLRSIKLALTFFHGLGLVLKNNIMFRVRSIHDIKNGLEQQRNMDDTMRILHRNGLDTALDREYQDIAEASGNFSKATAMGKVSDFIVHKNPMTRLVFGVVRVGLKNAYAHDTYPKMERLYIAAKEKELGRPLTNAEVKRTQDIAARAVVKRADSLFSGEDGRMGALEASKAVTQYYFNPTAQRIWSALLISKTWQREHIIEAKNLTKSLLMPKTMGPIAREHIKEIIGVAALMSIADVYNYFMTQWMDKKGTHLWDNPSGSKFSMRLPWNEPAYKRNAKGDTTAGGPAYVRPFKAITEIPELLAAFAPGERGDIVDKVASKLNPAIGATVNQLSYSGTHKTPGYLGRTEQLLTDLAPIAATVPVQVARERRNPWDLIPWALGAGLQKPVQVKGEKLPLTPDELRQKRLDAIQKRRDAILKRQEKFRNK